MNLMFWKKKTSADEEAARGNLAVNAKPRESLDFVAAKKGATGHSTEPSEPSGADETIPGTPDKPGLAARLKLWLNGLSSRFKKAPAFRAKAEPEAPVSPEKPRDAASVEAEPEASAKLGLGIRIKLQLITLVRRFRKTPAPGAESEPDGEAGESPASETTAKPGLFMRIKAGFAAFAREIKSPAAPAADEEEEAGSHGRSTAMPEEEFLEDELGDKPVHSRKWLVVGGSALIVILLIVDISITLWLAYEPPQKRWGTRHDITSISSRPLDSEAAPEATLNEAEALRKENAELQARIEALKNAQPQQRPYAPPAWQTGVKSAPSSSVGGETTVDSKDPKAAAMTLKEAIEAMNAGADDYQKKPAK